MRTVFAAIEQWPLSVWMREDPYAYFIALILHAWGMALLAGAGIAISLRGLGVARAAAIAGFRGFVPLMWLGAGLAGMSGLLLLAAYPAKALTNPVFAVKFASLITAAFLLRALLRPEVTPSTPRLLAAIALVLWLCGVAAGKLLLHTYTVLTVS